MASFFKTRLFIAVSHSIAKLPFQQLPNLKIRSLLKSKEGLKTATEIELLFLMASFFQNSLINCDFCLKLRAARLLQMHCATKSRFQQFKS